MLGLSAPANDILDHDHRTVHDQSEIERTQAHQVSGYIENTHQDRCKQHRKRDNRRDEQRSAPVSEQY